MNELDLQIHLLNWLLQTKASNQILSLEVPFSQYRRRADVVLLDEEKIIAYEIKSDVDSLDNFVEQQSDYLEYFNEFYLVTTSAHLEKAKYLLDSRTGLIVVDTEKFKIRKPRSRQLFNRHLIERELASQYSVSIDRIRKLPSRVLYGMYKTKIYDKYLPIYNIFKEERAAYISHEDIKILKWRTPHLPKV